ncbi:MAG: hypothetical protein V9F04_12755 [Dermatophilaceae bacterium]
MRQEAADPQQHDRRETVGEVVDDVVQQRAVESGQHLLDPAPAGEQPVRPVDDHRDEEKPQRRRHLALLDRDDHKEREDRTEGGVEMHQGGRQASGWCRVEGHVAFASGQKVAQVCRVPGRRGRVWLTFAAGWAGAHVTGQRGSG